MKKKIGISFSKTNFEYYWDWFSAGDLQDEVELVKLSFVDNNVDDICKCDGFILTGGIDVDPSLYAGGTSYQNSPRIFEPSRDHFEEKIYRYSQLNRLPLLGICRGMQLVNVLEGGKLIQDLDITGNKRHYPEENIDKEHPVITWENTLLYEVCGTLYGNVNSAHHQAIDPSAIGNNLRVNTTDYDDQRIIEGLEFIDKTGRGFMVCVQWHPERMRDREDNPFSRNIKKRFIEEIKKANQNEDH